MSDDFDPSEAINIGDLGLEKPDINEYLIDYEPEWLEVWDHAPVEHMSEGQIEALIDTIADMDWDEIDWESMLAEMDADYWDWFGEHYGESG